MGHNIWLVLDEHFVRDSHRPTFTRENGHINIEAEHQHGRRCSLPITRLHPWETNQDIY